MKKTKKNIILTQKLMNALTQEKRGTKKNRDSRSE